jgi:large subunit ribosomal protein L22
MSTAELERPEVRAVAKWVRISPRKARLVVDHIRGRSVPEARTVLAFTTRAAAREVDKVLRSAVANAEMNHGLVGDELVVSEAYVDDGLIIKRWKPRARGRVARIKKRTCHITIKLLPLDGAAWEAAVAEPEPVAEETEETPRTESAGALTPEEQAAAKPKPRRRARKQTEETEEHEPAAESAAPGAHPAPAGPVEGTPGNPEVPPRNEEGEES